MLVKPKWTTVVVTLSIGLFAALLPSFLLSTPAYADYEVSAGQKCDDQKDPRRDTSSNPVKYICSGERTSNQPATPTNPDEQGAASPTSNDDEGETCAIEKIGWILCPIIEQSGKIGDQAFQYLSKTFLETEPELVSSTEGIGTKYAWELARGLPDITLIMSWAVWTGVRRNHRLPK